MPFRDRPEAGRRLAAALSAYRGADLVVLALPRGGVPVAAEVARALGAPLDLLLVRKVGVPAHREVAMGAVADGGVTIRNPDVMAELGIREAEFAAACDTERAELERRRRAYIGARPLIDVAGRTVIVVDDGVATGATTRAALQAVRRRGPGALVLATPVAPQDALEALRKEADDVVCLEDLTMGSVGASYADFHQLNDDEVVDMLERLAPPGRA